MRSFRNSPLRMRKVSPISMYAAGVSDVDTGTHFTSRSLSHPGGVGFLKDNVNKNYRVSQMSRYREFCRHFLSFNRTCRRDWLLDCQRTLLFGILYDFWSINVQIGPKFWKCVWFRRFVGSWSRFRHVVSFDGNTLIQIKMTNSKKNGRLL